MAQERGLIATFMPKPFAHLTGNGCHFHMSLWKDGVNVFDAPTRRRPARPRASRRSPTTSSAVSRRTPRPTSRSPHRRSTPTSAWSSARSSGSAWAPVYISYGNNNRTQMLRIPAPGRIEDRTVDGSCNPYLAADRAARRGPRRHRARARTRASPTLGPQPARADDAERSASRGIETAARATCSTPRASSSATTCCATALGSCEREDYVDYFVATKQRRVAAGARPDHRLGAQALPAAVLAMDVTPDSGTEAAPAAESGGCAGRTRRSRRSSGSSARRPTSATCSTGSSTCSRRRPSCHACFVYLVAGDRLRLRAASPVYGSHVGRIEFGVDEGLAGWAVRHRQAGGSSATGRMDDPRTNFVPELEEERFQSMVAVPIPSRVGSDRSARSCCTPPRRASSTRARSRCCPRQRR